MTDSEAMNYAHSAWRPVRLVLCIQRRRRRTRSGEELDVRLRAKALMFLHDLGRDIA